MVHAGVLDEESAAVAVGDRDGVAAGPELVHDTGRPNGSSPCSTLTQTVAARSSSGATPRAASAAARDTAASTATPDTDAWPSTTCGGRAE